MTNRKRPYRTRVESKYLLHQRFGKASEKQLVKGFLERLELKPNQIRLSERPDFRLFFDDVKVGLELTLLYSDAGSRGSKARESFEVWYRVAKGLRQELIAAGLPFVYGSVIFKKREQLTKVLGKQLITELTNYCKANRIKRRDCITFTDFTGYPILSAYLGSIHLDSSFPSKGVLWWCEHLQSGLVEDTLPGLTRSIQIKDSLSRSYKWQPSQQRWLLVIARALTLADTAVLNQAQIETVSKQVTVTTFERIYFWDCFSENIWEVWPNPRILLNAGAAKLYVSRLPFAKK